VICMKNLDYICIKHGQKLDKSDTTLRKALGVLNEDGIYAMFLWLENENSEIRIKQLIPLLNDNGIKPYLIEKDTHFKEDFKDFCEQLSNISEDIDKLFFMKKVLERTLTYGLYHAKIKSGE